jgi:hypothetical protein
MRRESTTSFSQRSMTTHASFPCGSDIADAFAPRSGMVEGVAAEPVSVYELASHRMSASESAAAHHDHRSGVTSERQVDRRTAPYSGDDARREDRAAEVDAVVVAVADAEARIPGLTPAQRDPGHRVYHADHFDTADERNQSRCVDRLHGDRAGCPAPGSADHYPAAIMKRRVAPRSIVDPGPSPRRDETPVTETVRSPTGNHAVREPDVSIDRSRTPCARHVQIGDADHARCHAANRNGRCHTRVTFIAP